ncbi:MAG: hypothetical protein HQK83_05995 [Fibrobacteria bacterium]|nr:hypothetical protein [Fibrobacteria bacterium]
MYKFFLSLVRQSKLYMLAFAIAAVVFFTACTNLLETSGNSTETESGEYGEVYGSLILKDSSFAEGAVVEIISVESALAKGSAITSFSPVTTDDLGRFSFPKVDWGHYSLKAYLPPSEDSGDTLKAFIPHFELKEKKHDVGKNILLPPGYISVEVLIEGEARRDIMCHIPGVTPLFSSDASGVCFINNIPPGTYTVYYSYDMYLPGTLSNVVVTSGDTVSFLGETLIHDPAEIPPAPLNLTGYAKEGVVYLNWQQVLVTDLDGYVILRSDKKSDFSEQINMDKLIRDTVYVDSLFKEGMDWGTKSYRYNVMAQDTNRDQSSKSNTLIVTVDPPNIPALPAPSPDSSGISLSPILTWLSVTSEDGKKVTYDVYLDTVPEQLHILVGGQSRNYIEISNLLENTQYFWRVVAHIGDEIVDGSVWSFTTKAMPSGNFAPTMPSGPNPEDKAVDRNPVNTVLNWSSADEDKDDTIRFDVYLSTDSIPVTKVAKGHLLTTFTPPDLGNNTTYFWRIVASDGKATKVGPIWSFSTLENTDNSSPDKPSNPSPIEGAQEQGLVMSLSWIGGDPDTADNVTYSVYLGTEPEPVNKEAEGLSATKWDVSGLEENTKYYWKVVSTDGKTNVSGPIWYFTTKASEGNKPHIPSSPLPADSKIDQELSLTLSWKGGDPDSDDTVSYNMAFGTNSSQLANVPKVLLETEYALTGLEAATTYYWQVTASDGKSTVIGPVWSFTTKVPPPENSAPEMPQLHLPADSGKNLETTVTLLWSKANDVDDDVVRYNIRLSKTSPPIAYSDSSYLDTSLIITGLTSGATYYWQVIASDGKESSSSDVQMFSVKAPAVVNAPPHKPTNPTPSDKNDSVSSSLTLSWNGGDPDADDTVSYTFYLDENSNPTTKLETITSKTSYQVSDLKENTTYYWRIEANDGEATALSDIWRFTTSFEKRILAYWNFNEGSGTQLRDQSGNGHHATLNGPQWVDGVDGKALKFDGVDDYGIVSFDESLAPQQLTVSAWVKLNSLPTGVIGTIIGNQSQDATRGGYVLNVSGIDVATRGLVYFTIDAGSDCSSAHCWWEGAAGDSVLAINKWYHVAGTFDGSCLKMYVDGVLEDNICPENASLIHSDAPLGIGYENVASQSRYLNGVIDEIVIYNYALDQSSISTLYSKYENTNHAPHIPSSPSPGHSSTNNGLDVTLRWTDGDPDAGDVVTFNLYFGKTSPPALVAEGFSQATYQVSGLNGGTKFYWRVEATDGNDTTLGPVWEFTTTNSAPISPHTPAPQAGAVDQQTSLTLSWSGGDPDTGDAVTYDVYLDLVSPPVERIVEGTSSLTKQVSGLDSGKTYYWKVVAKDGTEITSGPVWAFSTVEELWTTTPKTAAYWKFSRTDFGTSTTFANRITNSVADSKNIVWSTTPQFESIGGIKGVATGGSAYGSTASNSAFTVDNTSKIISYRIRCNFKDANYSLPEGNWLVGFYEGPGIGLDEEGLVTMRGQNSGNTATASWLGGHAWNSDLSQSGNWYDIILTYDASDPDNLEIHTWVNGEYFSFYTWRGVYYDGMRTNNLSEFMLGKIPNGSYTMDGIVSDLLIEHGYIFQPPQRRVAHWDFNTGTGTVLMDKSGNGNNGVIYGATWVDGIEGKALSFNGASSFVKCEGAWPYGNMPRTMTMWARTDTNSAQSMAFYGDTTSTPGKSFGGMLNHEEEGVTPDVSYGAATYKASTDENIWHFYAFVVPEQSNITVNDVLVYRDGVRLTSTGFTWETWRKLLTQPSQALYIGKTVAQGSNYYFFDGVIDELSIYNYPLNQVTIDSLYGLHTPPRTVAHWDFNEGTGSILTDLSGNGNNGTIYGAQWVSGQEGNALDFDGSEDWVDLGTCVKKDESCWTVKDFMVSISFMPETFEPSQQEIFRWGSYNGDITIQINSDTLVVGVMHNVSPWWTTIKKELPSDKKNTWNKVILSYNNTTGTMKAYVNGEYLGSKTGSGDLYLPNGYPPSIGNYIEGGGSVKKSYFNGKIDEIRVYPFYEEDVSKYWVF